MPAMSSNFSSESARSLFAGAPARETALTTEGAEATLRRYMVEKGLRPGDRLPSEADLCVTMGRSRMLIREALRSLEALGLLEARAGSGWYVRGFDVAAATQIFARSLAFHPRAVLEVMAVRRSAEADTAAALAGRLSEEDLVSLEELADRMNWRAARGQSTAAEDGAFHRQIAVASGNLFLVVLVDLHWAIKGDLFRTNGPPLSAAASKGNAKSHTQIVAALRRGDGSTAAAVMRDHHDAGERRFAKWLESQRDLTPGGEQAIADALAAAMLWPAARAGERARL